MERGEVFEDRSGQREAACILGARLPGVDHAGAEHLEGFGDLDGVARAEGEMFAALGAGATAVVNADDGFAPLWREMSTAGRCLTFGIVKQADFRARNVSCGIERGEWLTRFDLDTPAGSVPVRLALTGVHNVLNAAGRDNAVIMAVLYTG